MSSRLNLLNLDTNLLQTIFQRSESNALNRAKVLDYVQKTPLSAKVVFEMSSD